MKLFVTLLALMVSWTIVHVNSQGDDEDAWKTYQVDEILKFKAHFKKIHCYIFFINSLYNQLKPGTMLIFRRENPNFSKPIV